MSKLFYYESVDKGTKIQQALDYIDQAKEFIKEEESRLIQSTIGINNKIMPVKPANLMGKIHSVSQYKTYDLDVNNELRHKSGYFNKPNTVEQTCANALRHAEHLFKQSEAIHEGNIKALENNTALKDYIYAFMGKIGIPRTITTYDYISSSGRKTQKRQEHTKSAGYIGDVQAFIKTDDGFEYAKQSYEKIKKDIEAYRLAEDKKEKEAQRLIDLDNAKKEEEKLLATLIVKYGVDYQSTFKEVLEAILERNKYLELGYWLERQRNDWSDGFWKAKEGIDGFVVETDLDGRIKETLRDVLSEAEDGRDFRDCQYNYSELYALVDDKDLYNDFRLVFDKTNDY